MYIVKPASTDKKIDVAMCFDLSITDADSDIFSQWYDNRRPSYSETKENR